MCWENRSLTGARIETSTGGPTTTAAPIAPSQERGLKRRALSSEQQGLIAPSQERGLKLRDRFEPGQSLHIAPSQERGLKLFEDKPEVVAIAIAPSQERGLKHRTELIAKRR